MLRHLWPGRLERHFGTTFPLGQDIENQTNPWGLASIWAGSRVRYSWKGLCACDTLAPYQDRQTAGEPEVMKWQGPDDKTIQHGL